VLVGVRELLEDGSNLCTKKDSWYKIYVGISTYTDSKSPRTENAVVVWGAVVGTS
jgi:hypothetical protein